jgi:hypothetical protein
MSHGTQVANHWSAYKRSIAPPSHELFLDVLTQGEGLPIRRQAARCLCIGQSEVKLVLNGNKEQVFVIKKSAKQNQG